MSQLARGRAVAQPARMSFLNGVVRDHDHGQSGARFVLPRGHPSARWCSDVAWSIRAVLGSRRVAVSNRVGGLRRRCLALVAASSTAHRGRGLRHLPGKSSMRSRKLIRCRTLQQFGRHRRWVNCRKTERRGCAHAVGDRHRTRSHEGNRRFRRLARKGRKNPFGAGEARLIDAMVERNSRVLDAGGGPGRVGRRTGKPAVHTWSGSMPMRD